MLQNAATIAENNTKPPEKWQKTLENDDLTEETEAVKPIYRVGCPRFVVTILFANISRTVPCILTILVAS